MGINEWTKGFCEVGLRINNPHLTVYDKPVIIDLETDEKDNFVGGAFTYDGVQIDYTTDIDTIRAVVRFGKLVGHNLKGDVHWLKKWGCRVSSESILFDTMLASYVINPTRRSHGLKILAKELFGFEYPHYKDMTGKGKKKKTLDQLPVEDVANYCGMDCLCTYRLYEYFTNEMTLNHQRVFNQLEMPMSRILFDMEEQGIMIDVNKLKELDDRYTLALHKLFQQIGDITDPLVEKIIHESNNYKLEWQKSAVKYFMKHRHMNPNSWQQKKLVLWSLGHRVESTNKLILQRIKDVPLVTTMMEYSQYSKLKSGFVDAFKEIPTLPIIHTTYNQVAEDATEDDLFEGIKSGRLSSSNPNLQQIPSRTDEGKLLRELFIPRDGQMMCSIDYSQIELRLLAHFSHEPLYLDAFLKGEDVHQATTTALNLEAQYGENARFYGKTANFAIAFGCSKWRLADTLNTDVDSADRFIKQFWGKYSTLYRWRWRTIERAKQNGGITTLFGRFIPIDNLKSYEYKLRGSAERKAINYTIQGSAADILKLATIKLVEIDYRPILTVHDELVFELSPTRSEGQIQTIKTTMETIVKLDVPLLAEAGKGENWGKCK